MSIFFSFFFFHSTTVKFQLKNWAFVEYFHRFIYRGSLNSTLKNGYWLFILFIFKTFKHAPSKTSIVALKSPLNNSIFFSKQSHKTFFLTKNKNALWCTTTKLTGELIVDSSAGLWFNQTIQNVKCFFIYTQLLRMDHSQYLSFFF